MRQSGALLAIVLVAASVMVAPPPASGADNATFKTETVTVLSTVLATGLKHPWGMDFLPGGGILVTERPGRLRFLGADGALSDPVEGVPPVWAHGQGGLFDVALARDFAESGTIFLSYAEPGDGGAGTAVARGRLVRDGATARLTDVRVIYSMKKKTGGGLQFGSRIVVNGDGTLFVTTGDRGEADRAQDLADTAGAVLRIGQDGAVPKDNPYVNFAGAAPELWSKGHRNVQGAAADSKDGRLWTVEHGARGGDELNHPEPGKNYGWPVISYGVEYSGAKIGEGQQKAGYEQPVHYWDPSIAPSGLAIYRGAMFPEWEGDFLVGALKFQLLSRLHRDATGAISGEERMLKGQFGRIRDVKVAPDGSVWLLTDEENGKVIRLTRAE